eukprot:CAMPEP_0172557478 /NCGR_PEP_ID=MMETSP1067-20121228/73472_1 /TAXON_ID=265564 ORGANISM="Thalassiosira punctigera, Strain Tpunct2005C2" /NCGR_SAMPLE_ID=MMETSP1067 /ASSEMBLY_ACC=CAM_ASM_000444 /LENGTH=55 /DNA_ID=CAMNT_0013346567 /DNA_START=90 /DNA_END=254 /DNA_ORIENTATION=+
MFHFGVHKFRLNLAGGAAEFPPNPPAGGAVHDPPEHVMSMDHPRGQSLLVERHAP